MYLIYTLCSYTIALALFPGLHPSTRADSSHMYAVMYWTTSAYSRKSTRYSCRLCAICSDPHLTSRYITVYDSIHQTFPTLAQKAGVQGIMELLSPQLTFCGYVTPQRYRQASNLGTVQWLLANHEQRGLVMAIKLAGALIWLQFQNLLSFCTHLPF